MEEYNFLKKTFANIEINIFNKVLKDLSSIMEFIHLVVSSIKIFLTNPSDIYECLYPIEYSNYYFTTFCFFLDFFKKETNTNRYYNKFIIDVIKFLYIYSYYDYYFYFSNEFVETLIENLQYKNEMFLEFTQNLKKTLKLPNELNNFPPFFSQEFDINAIIYYNFEIPGYFKLYDFMNAIYNVFELKSPNKHDDKINIFDLIVNNIFFDNQSNYLNSISKNVSIGLDNINKISSNSNSNSDSDSDSESDILTSNVYDRKQGYKSRNNYGRTHEKIQTQTQKQTQKQIQTQTQKQTQKQIQNKKELESNLDSEIINVLGDNDKTQMENTNAYVELNYKIKNENYILDTEC